MLHRDLQKLGVLHSIRKVGATNSNEESYCQSPSLFRAMLRIYERDFTENEG